MIRVCAFFHLAYRKTRANYRVLEDERSIANKLAAQEGSGQHSHPHNKHGYYAEGELSKMDPTKPVCFLDVALGWLVC